jgi:hypothetical protein
MAPLLTNILLSLFSLISLVSAYYGDMTYYAPGLGSCGQYNGPGDPIVALSVSMMQNGANPNSNPKCGTTISITSPATGQTLRATVVDTCYACSHEDIDLSPSLFQTVAPNGDGRVHGIVWGW